MMIIALSQKQKLNYNQNYYTNNYHKLQVIRTIFTRPKFPHILFSSIQTQTFLLQIITVNCRISDGVHVIQLVFHNL